MKVSKAFEQAIKTMVDQYAESDSLFRSKLENEKKSITQCCEYICSEVKKIGRQGYADEEILQMAIHYYDEDDIKFDDPGEMTVVTNQIEELEVKESRQLTYSPIGHWVSYLTTAGGYQIERFFLLEYYIRKGSEPHTSVKEFLVRFMNGKGTQYIVSRRRSRYYDNFCMHSDFEIRDSGMFECVLSDYTYHTGRLINELKRRNFHVHDTDCAFLVAKRFLSEGAYERLWKLGQYKFAQDMLFRGGIGRYYNQLRICSRNGTSSMTQRSGGT